MKELNFDHERKPKARIGGAGSMANPAYYRMKRHDKKHLGAEQAYAAVKKAIKKGRLACLKENVVKCTLCERRATVYDHRDYNKPLQVEPLCKHCNEEMGAAIPLGGYNAK